MKILLLRLRLIGDVVFTTPAIAALRHAYPDAHLSYLVEDPAQPIVSASPHLSEVIAIPHRRGLARILDDARLAWVLRAKRFDLAIDFHGGPRSAWLTWATRARVRVGYDVPGRSWMYTRVVSRPRGYRPRHAVENQWDLLAEVDESLNIPPSPDRHRVEMWPGTDAERMARAKLASLGVPPDGRLVILHVSAGNPFRRWPEASFARVSASLAGGAPNRYVMVTSGPSDRDAARRVITSAREQAGSAALRILAADVLSLQELRASLALAVLFIGGDSGPLHVAATSDVPIVGIYGPTLPQRSAPWRPASLRTASVEPGVLPCRPCDQRVCAPGDFRCLSQVEVEAVLGEAERLLEQPA